VFFFFFFLLFTGFIDELLYLQTRIDDFRSFQSDGGNEVLLVCWQL